MKSFKLFLLALLSSLSGCISYYSVSNSSNKDQEVKIGYWDSQSVDKANKRLEKCEKKGDVRRNVENKGNGEYLFSIIMSPGSKLRLSSFYPSNRSRDSMQLCLPIIENASNVSICDTLSSGNHFSKSKISFKRKNGPSYLLWPQYYYYIK